MRVSAIQEPEAVQILAYLTQHPGAQDTVEGITEWWLLEQRIVSAMQEVKRALAHLVRHHLLLARLDEDGRRHYRVNPEKQHEIRRLLDRYERSSVSRRSATGRSRSHKRP